MKPNDQTLVHGLIEHGTDAFVALDRKWRIICLNQHACSINKKTAADLLGTVHWDEWPALVGTEAESQLREAMERGTEVHLVHQYRTGEFEAWIEMDAYPAEWGINLYYRDITEAEIVSCTNRESDNHRYIAAKSIREPYEVGVASA